MPDTAPPSMSAVAAAPLPAPTGSLMVTVGTLVYPEPTATTSTATSWSVVDAVAGVAPAIGSNSVPLWIATPGGVE